MITTDAILENLINELTRAYPNKNQAAFNLGYVQALFADVMSEKQAEVLLQRIELLREVGNKKALNEDT